MNTEYNPWSPNCEFVVFRDVTEDDLCPTYLLDGVILQELQKKVSSPIHEPGYIVTCTDCGSVFWYNRTLNGQFGWRVH